MNIAVDGKAASNAGPSFALISSKVVALPATATRDVNFSGKELALPSTAPALRTDQPPVLQRRRDLGTLILG
jgi:hypothetical protein